jgi:hypothetical protein
MVEKYLNRLLLLHLKYENESEKGKVRQQNVDSIGLNIENDAVRFGYFRSVFILIYHQS